MRTMLNAVDNTARKMWGTVALSCLIGIVWAFISLLLFLEWWGERLPSFRERIVKSLLIWPAVAAYAMRHLFPGVNPLILLFGHGIIAATLIGVLLAALRRCYLSMP